MVRLLPLFEEVQIFFAFLDRREVMPMYMTLEALLLFCTLVVAIVGLVVDICNKKR